MLNTPTELLALRSVLAAARAWGTCKDRAKAEWIETGVVSPTTTNSLDKATDNLLVVLAAQP